MGSWHWRWRSASFSGSGAGSGGKDLRRMRSEIGRFMHRKSLVRAMFAVGVAWALFVLVIWGMLLVACGSVSVTVESAGQCKKKSQTFQFLDAWGFIPKPIHRCSIPVARNPQFVQIPSFRHDSSILRKLTYITNDRVAKGDQSKRPLFGGYQTWKERDESFKIKPAMQVHCGFMNNSGGDIHPRDKTYLKRCEFVVASGIFDGYDMPHQPSNLSDASRSLFCFAMVVDEISLDSIKAEGLLTEDDKGGRWSGIWRLVLLKNLPYDEPRRNGKVPKLLTHRIFPAAKYSIWIDGKMELVVDPILILERYLWRGGHKFAIARHKHHKSIYEEADANKRRKRYARPLIDKHMEIYKREGMQPWSKAKLPVLSDVPEGAVIIREHTPLTNLFCCLWFNEVNRFTPRDQLSFGYVVHRLNGSFPLFMFPNCEYNALFVLHKHTREHSSKVEWVKTLDELKDENIAFETRAGLGLLGDR
ncbi:uncharacterized protein LOC9656562 isoform X1 [Selaginella moellendorffii]|nr:uncharacterized protein LOC9656562 isoform X1 [Selaginella moellendorffii]|eukprot:XP_002980574.2 uncharacterized protein LOC9656562 isoform X1 [Selaginella moellendorffii]